MTNTTKTIPKTILILAIAVAFVSGTAVSAPDVFAKEERPKLDDFTLQYTGSSDPVVVEIYDKASSDSKAKQMSSTTPTVYDGTNFTYTAADMDLNKDPKWKNDSYFRLLESGSGIILAEIKIHVSCSQPLADGTEFTDGSYTLTIVGNYCDPDGTLPPADTCDDGYHMENGVCVEDTPLPPLDTCENGTGNGVECTSCDLGYDLDNGFCIEDPAAFCSAVMSCIPEPLDGFNCWDLNENHEADIATEDLNSDGVVNVEDCQGTDGTNGNDGMGLSCENQFTLAWMAEDSGHTFIVDEACGDAPPMEVCEADELDITAGQTNDIGDITITDDGVNMFITVTPADNPLPNPPNTVDATIGHYHLGIYDDLEDLPNGGTSRDPPGQLEVVGDPNHNPGGVDLIPDATEPFVITVPMAAINAIDTDMDGTIIVLHFETDWIDENGDVMTGETAYAEGTDPDTNGAWWFYHEYNKCVLP